jgi:GNAT superfamily N-acetyltransferase
MSPSADDSPLVLRSPGPGDLGWVVHRQALLYAREYGWDWRFEGLVAEIVGNFVRDHDPAAERCWIAQIGTRIVGSVFLVRASPQEARLRLLYVESDARGLGIGARLVDECIAAARALGYQRLTLWTNDVLVAARRLYQARGFVLSSEERHHSFGRDLVGQHWSLALTPGS